MHPQTNKGNNKDDGFASNRRTYLHLIRFTSNKDDGFIPAISSNADRITTATTTANHAFVDAEIKQASKPNMQVQMI
jgi:hypothetical protein